MRLLKSYSSFLEADFAFFSRRFSLRFFAGSFLVSFLTSRSFDLAMKVLLRWVCLKANKLSGRDVRCLYIRYVIDTVVDGIVIKVFHGHCAENTEEGRKSLPMFEI